MLKVADSGALQFQSFQRPMYMVLTGNFDTPTSSTKAQNLCENRGFFMLEDFVGSSEASGLVR